MILGPAGPETVDNCAGECNKQFTHFPDTLTLKMATAVFAETLNNVQYSTWRVSES
jgi:hypothetical protein